MSFFKNPFKSNTTDCDNTVDFNVVPSFEKNDLQGKNGENGKSITIINSYINPDGNTIIKFSDGSSIIVNKGLKGDTGDKGDKGDDGKTISIVSTNSTVGPTGTIIEINFSDNSTLTFFVQRGETGNNGQDGIYITEAIIDTNSLSVTYGHLIITLSNASVIDAGYVLGGLTDIAGGELDGTYPNPNLKNSAVIGKVLTGLSLATGGVIAATDSILQAFGKLQKQIFDGIPSGTISQYIRGDGSLATFPTALPPSGVAGGELSGTYPNPTLVTTAVTSKLLVGLPLFSNTPITSDDSILSAFSKIQGQINNIPSLPSFTVGSVLFGNGTGITENNSKFFWDNTLFKLKLTDSKLELLNTSLLGSSLLEYKNLSSVASTVLDQTNNTIDNFLKIRSYNSWSSGLHFGTIDGIDTTAGQVGLTYNSIGIIGAPNQLLINNLYGSTGLIRIQANGYTQVDGLAIKKSFVHTFNTSSSATAAIIYPYNVCRFNYGDNPVPTLTVRLPYNTFLPIPDGYIVIIKALNDRGSFSPVVVSVNPSSTQTLEAFTFNVGYQSVIYRYDLTADRWDIIAKF